MKRHGVPGMACAIVWRGRVTAQGVLGVRRQGSPQPATLDDRWHLGSCTKAMTATLAAILANDGVISLDTPITEALADHLATTRVDSAWRHVTLDMLLHNRGGAPQDIPADDMRACCAGGLSPTESRLELAKRILARPPAVAPGTSHVYSNAGFAMVGAALELRTGTAWERLMQDSLWAPLGITTGSFGAPGTSSGVDAPHGHTESDCRPVAPGPGSDNPAAIGPAGTAAMTVRDWARFVALHLDQGRGATAPRLLSPAAFKRLHWPLQGDEAAYAMGWVVSEQPGWGGRCLTHSGDNTLWHCTSWLAPEKEFALLVATNRSGASVACNDVVLALIGDHRTHEGASAL
jgi:CubicO group peptidase (beta-lactamase class C family)